MRINITALLAAAGLAASATCSERLHEQDRRNHLASLLEKNRIFLEQAQPACNLTSCSSVSSTITCVMSAISSGDPTALQKCLTDGLTDICTCAACIPPLLDIFQSLGVCVTSPTPPGGGGNETVTHFLATVEPLSSNGVTSSMVKASTTGSTSAGVLTPATGPIYTIKSNFKTKSNLNRTPSSSVVASPTSAGISGRAVTPTSKMRFRFW